MDWGFKGLCVSLPSTEIIKNKGTTCDPVPSVGAPLQLQGEGESAKAETVVH